MTDQLRRKYVCRAAVVMEIEMEIEAESKEAALHEFHEWHLPRQAPPMKTRLGEVKNAHVVEDK
jgi:hypothetical protein